MYRRFIEANFGRVHLKGFEYLVAACEMFADGNHKISSVYHDVARKYKHEGATYARVERDIRHYINGIDPYVMFDALPYMPNATNKAVVAAIVYAIDNSK